MSSSERKGWIEICLDEVLGSAPRDAGTTMWVSANGTSGTIGGGALEWRAMAHARELLDGKSGPWTLDLPLGPALAQCCGGHVRISFRLVPEIEAQPLTSIKLHIHGAGHVGQALICSLAVLPFDLHVYDTRSGMPKQHATFHQNHEAKAQPGDFHLVMTHSHQLDLEIVGNILEDGHFGFLGLIGSQTKRARFERNLKSMGLEPNKISRLVCPIGIAGITGKAPEMIAVSVTAQLLIAREASLASGRNKQLVTAPE